jgi:hypothetical protein
MATHRDDPVLVSARREALIVFATWVAAMVYCIGYCSVYAYGRKAEDLRYIYGFPDWVWWGVVVPWGACLAFSWIFAGFFMRDEDLGEDPAETEQADESGRGA